MTLPELSSLLRKRGLNSPAINNELGKVYGVTRMPPQQAQARLEAIELLENYDKRKFSLSKLLGILASIATIIGLFVALS